MGHFHMFGKNFPQSHLINIQENVPKIALPHSKIFQKFSPDSSNLDFQGPIADLNLNSAR